MYRKDTNQLSINLIGKVYIVLTGDLLFLAGDHLCIALTVLIASASHSVQPGTPLIIFEFETLPSISTTKVIKQVPIIPLAFALSGYTIVEAINCHNAFTPPGYSAISSGVRYNDVSLSTFFTLSVPLLGGLSRN